MFEMTKDSASLEERLDFLQLEGPAQGQPQPQPTPKNSPEIGSKQGGSVSGNGRATIAGSTLATFTGEVSAQDRQTVLDCTLYLEQYTDTLYDRETQWYEWLQHYTLGLWHLGWRHERPVMLESLKTTLYEPICDVVLEKLKPVVAPSLYDVTYSAFLALKDNLDASRALSLKSSREKGRDLQVMPCTYDRQGNLTVAFHHLWVAYAKTPEQFLFLRWENHEATLVMHYGVFTLDRKRFSELAEAMRKKITERSLSYLVNMKL